MVTRVLPLLIALAVAGAPMAVDLCQVTCVSSAPQSCHHDAAVTAARVSHQPHPCGHEGEGQPSALSSSARPTPIDIPLAVLSDDAIAFACALTETLSGTPLSADPTGPTNVRSVILRI